MKRSDVMRRIKPLLNSFDFHFEICGSIRRGHANVKNVNILAGTYYSRLARDLIDYDKFPLFLPEVSGKCVSFLFEDVPIHILCSDVERWGSNLLFWTGSLRFTILLRKWAKKRHMMLTRNGLFHNTNLIASRTEKQILYALEVEDHFIDPKNRG